MDALKKFFPFSFTAKNDIVALIINIVIYAIAGAVFGIVISILNWIPIVGTIISIAGALVELYVFVGIVLSCLDYFKVLK